MATDDDERFLMWADMAAGLCHGARLESMPMACSASRRVLEPLVSSNKLVLNAYAFGSKYDDVFGEAMSAARGEA